MTQRLNHWMQNALLALVAACLFSAGSVSLRAQDDNAAPPPTASDTGTLSQDANGAPSSDTGPAPTADQPTGPTAPITFQTFYDALEPMGTWIQTSDYGYVWQPNVNDPDWAPYTVGHWVYTDDGWTWASDEPWGWATYHYGRWINLQNIGWVWVPGYTWAPAWVSWRYGDGYAAWAPLPPDSLVGIDYANQNNPDDTGSSDEVDDDDSGYHIGGDCDAFYGIGPIYYIFLPVRCLGYRNYHGYYCNRYDNFALINHTTNVTNLNVARHGGAVGFHRVNAGGPSLAEVNAASTTPMTRVRLVHATQPGVGSLTNQSLALYAPHVGPSVDQRPARVSRSINQATINHGTDVLQPLAVNNMITPSAATEAQVQQARISINHTPTSAKVVTDVASIQPVIRAPLATMRPLAAPEFASRSMGPNPPSNQFSSEPRSTYPQGNQSAPRTYQQQFGPGMQPTRIYNSYTGTPAAPSSTVPHATMPQSSGVPENRGYEHPSAPSSSPAPSASVYRSSGGGTPAPSTSSGGYSGSPSSGAPTSAPSSSGTAGGHH